MQLARLIAAASAIGAAILASSPAAAADGALIHVGRNVQVSRSRDRIAHGEVLLSADPADPNRLLGCSMAFDPERNKTYTIVYASSDGGSSWTPTLDTAEYEFSGDPACALGSRGRGYYMALGYKEGDSKFGGPIYRSADGGRTWDAPLVFPAFHGLDREYIAVDNTSGRFGGRVYMHATGWMRPMEGKTKIADISLFTSRDGGASFAGPVKRGSVGKRYVLGVGNSVVLSDGTVVLVFGEINRYWDEDGETGDVPESTGEKANGVLKVVASTDGGDSLEEAVSVADFHMLWPPSATSMIGYLAASPPGSPFPDRVFAVWPDQRSGRQEILIAHSDDKGKSWSKPVVVNDDPPLPDSASPRDHLMPTVAVNADGVVGVAWYDRRDSEDNLGWWVRFRASLDGGETFVPSVRVSEAASAFGSSDRWTVLASSSGGGRKPSGVPDAKAPGGPISVNLALNGFEFNGGHTAGIAVDASGVFHPLWIDNRTGLAQVWTAPVSVTGRAVKNGSPDLASLDDVSPKVELVVTATDFDRKSNRVTLRARLKNTSEERIAGPFKLRLLRLTSELGRPEALDTENGDRGPGAVWDWGAAIPGGELEPGAESQPRELAFRLQNLRPFRLGKTIRYGLVQLDARVLARLEPSAKAPAAAGGNR